MPPEPAHHTHFALERFFAAPPAAVFQAWADPQAKRQWSDCHAEHTVAFSLDFRPLGRQHHRVLHPEHGEQVVDQVFFEIQPQRRIVFGYQLTANGRCLSVSLVTIEFAPEAGGTKMVYTEQLAYLDGHRDLEQRIHGTGEGLDRLRLAVEAGPAAVQ